jgi:hypothetical protein
VRRVANEDGVSAAAECSAYALCSDVVALSWTAITPCPGCVTAAVVGSVRAATGERHTASPAQVVTGDALGRLLCRARQSPANGRTSSR